MTRLRQIFLQKHTPDSSDKFVTDSYRKHNSKTYFSEKFSLENQQYCLLYILKLYTAVRGIGKDLSHFSEKS